MKIKSKIIKIGDEIEIARNKILDIRCVCFEGSDTWKAQKVEIIYLED